MEAELDALFAPWDRSDAPGVTVGVRWKGAVVYRKAFGMASLETGVALTSRTGMRMGSVSKHFTALLALLLAEDGRLDLDAPIRRYVPEMTGPGGDPTIRMLLQHRGGSRCYVDLGFIAQGMALPPVGSALALQARQTGRNFAPGESMIYNNGGYHLVSLAIERVGGAAFEHLIKARLFDPLGMADTASVPSDLVIAPGMATLHLPASGGGWRRGLFPTEELRGEGAIVSTVDDMLRWMDHLRARDRFGSPGSWAALVERPRFPDDSVGAYALGLFTGHYRGAPVVEHAGGVVGGSSQMIQFTDHALDVVVMSNGAAGADPVALSKQIADIVLGDRLATPAPVLASSAYAEILGPWWSEETGMLYALIDDGGALKLSACGAPSGSPLRLSAEGRLVCSTSGLGDIVIDLASAGAKTLDIQFGGRSARYWRPGPPPDPEAFAALADGTYLSADADCVATVDGSSIALRSAFGSHRCDLVAIGDTVAVVQADQAGDPFHLSLAFDGGSEPAPRFRANSVRTRDLIFQRRESAL